MADSIVIKDRKGIVQVFGKNERSGGTVSKLYGQWNTANYGKTGKTEKPKKEFQPYFTPVESTPEFDPYFLPPKQVTKL